MHIVTTPSKFNVQFEYWEASKHVYLLTMHGIHYNDDKQWGS